MNECCDACLKMLPSSECVKEDCPCHSQKTSTSGWEAEFREYFDKNLKPKKADMRNLDREILVNFIRTILNDQKTSLIEEIVKFEREEVPYLWNDDADKHKQNLNLHNSLQKLLFLLKEPTQ